MTLQNKSVQYLFVFGSIKFICKLIQLTGIESTYVLSIMFIIYFVQLISFHRIRNYFFINLPRFPEVCNEFLIS